MQQSTNIQPELEPEIDFNDQGPHIVQVQPFRVDHAKEARYLHYICPLCSQAASVKLLWTSFGVKITHPKCRDKPLSNTEIHVDLPPGYKEHQDNGNAYPGTSYPPPAKLVSDREQLEGHDIPAPGPCPKNCIRDHHDDDADGLHFAKMYTSFIESDDGGTPKLMVRTQNFHNNSDPSDSFGWTNFQILDMETNQWTDLDLAPNQADAIARILFQNYRGSLRFGNNTEVFDSE